MILTGIWEAWSKLIRFSTQKQLSLISNWSCPRVCQTTIGMCSMCVDSTSTSFFLLFIFICVFLLVLFYPYGYITYKKCGSKGLNSWAIIIALQWNNAFTLMRGLYLVAYYWPLLLEIWWSLTSGFNFSESSVVTSFYLFVCSYAWHAPHSHWFKAWEYSSCFSGVHQSTWLQSTILFLS